MLKQEDRDIMRVSFLPETEHFDYSKGFSMVQKGKKNQWITEFSTRDITSGNSHKWSHSIKRTKNWQRRYFETGKFHTNTPRSTASYDVHKHGESLKRILYLSFYSDTCKTQISVTQWFFYISLCGLYSCSYLRTARAGRNMLQINTDLVVLTLFVLFYSLNKKCAGKINVRIA